MNNKGFALSILVYTILGIFIVVTATMMISVRNSTSINHNIKKSIIEENDVEEEGVFKCKGAYTLHTDQNGDDFGQIPMGTTYQSGDAFDCDVNGDGEFDEKTERFYYVSDYFDTQEKTFNSDYAVLLYYNNVSGGLPNNTLSYSYYGKTDSTHSTPTVMENWNGPQKDETYTAYYQLPSTTQWSNVSLYKTNRVILNENNGNTVIVNGTSHQLPQSYSYDKKAARFLTLQEAAAGCPNGVRYNYQDPSNLDECKYFKENAKYVNSSYTPGYWLETPLSSGNFVSVWLVNVDTSSNYITNNVPFLDYVYSARPVIEVKKTDIER